MTRYFQDLHPLEPDRSKWTVAHALRKQANAGPDRTFLIVPEEGRAVDVRRRPSSEAERVGGGLVAGGAAR